MRFPPPRATFAADTLHHPQILIDYAGADIIDAPDLYGNTPLHYASSWGKLPVSCGGLRKPNLD